MFLISTVIDIDIDTYILFWCFDRLTKANFTWCRMKRPDHMMTDVAWLRHLAMSSPLPAHHHYLVFGNLNRNHEKWQCVRHQYLDETDWAHCLSIGFVDGQAVVYEPLNCSLNLGSVEDLVESGWFAYISRIFRMGHGR